MLFLDNPAPDSCCAERPLHIPTYPRLVSTAATVREKTWEQIHTHRYTHTQIHTHRYTHTDTQTDKPIDYNNPSLRMHARGLITIITINTIKTILGVAKVKHLWAMVKMSMVCTLTTYTQVGVHR